MDIQKIRHYPVSLFYIVGLHLLEKNLQYIEQGCREDDASSGVCNNNMLAMCVAPKDLVWFLVAHTTLFNTYLISPTASLPIWDFCDS